jgi:tRNA (adenine58-N1)-methyltransferase non-catalytic subunit
MADGLVNQPYGLTYEIVNKAINVVPPPAMEELGRKIINKDFVAFDDVDTEDTDATNELINDGQFVQPLTATEIESLKQSGLHASVIRYILALAPILMEPVGRRKS